MKKQKLLLSACAAVLAGTLLLSAADGIFPVKVQALSSDEIQSQIDELKGENEKIQNQLAELEQQKSENYSEIQQVVEQKNAIDQQIALLYTQVDNINTRISAYTALIADKQEELDAALLRFQALSEKNKERIRAMEEDGAISYWSVLFKSNSFSDFLDRLNMVQEIAASDQRRLDEMNQAARAVSNARDTLVAEKAALETTKEELAASEAELTVRRQESDELLKELLDRGEEYLALIAQGEVELDGLMDRIAQKEKEYTDALQKEWEAAHPTVPETEPPATKPEETRPGETEPEETQPEETEPDEPEEDGPPSSGGWTVPCSYVYVSSPFSDGRMHPILGYVRPHNGIDLAAYLGNPVYATRSGTVTVAEWDDQAGNYVYINHGDGFSSGYMHLNSYNVSVGEYVSAGEVIGYVGTTGLSEGPHLHFSIAYNGTYVNPANYIDF